MAWYLECPDEYEAWANWRVRGSIADSRIEADEARIDYGKRPVIGP